MEVWGGIECTINRLGDEYFDQLAFAGHYGREADIPKIVGLGIQRIRYPVLWETHQPEREAIIDWSGTAAALEEFRHNGVGVIAGLVHHGCGPVYVNLTDNSFEKGLADYAYLVAERFPWLEYYTPVNEPLTTARFCGLYGLWHPHKKTDETFLRILMSECRATRAAMKAIRKVNPQAKLIQTEDLGETHCTPFLRSQANFENQRRWLSMDLLCGKVNPTHPLWEYITENGISPQELEEIAGEPCMPEIYGVNYYITSERYLDENLEIYPEHTHGGSGSVRYADVEAVRSPNAVLSGVDMLLRAAFDRYNIPVALTEVHLHCGREDQLKWLMQIDFKARRLEAEGVNMVAITAWSLLGSFGWRNLLTTGFEDYEPGAFDLSKGLLRPTALADLVQAIATGETYAHPAVQGRGWWETTGRFAYGSNDFKVPKTDALGRPVLIIGEDLHHTEIYESILDGRRLAYKTVESAHSLESYKQVKLLINKLNPWSIICLVSAKDIKTTNFLFKVSDEINKMSKHVAQQWKTQARSNGDTEGISRFRSARARPEEYAGRYGGQKCDQLPIMIIKTGRAWKNVEDQKTKRETANQVIDLLIDGESGYLDHNGYILYKK
ncbi:hypothetical protein [Pedobacter sp.]|uniref:hypothetical protein n=1 Tax=Pedobacter sp. TaxID=1411316 RepID=UPI003C4E9EB9